MSNSEIIIYQTDNGQTKIDVRLQDETVWLSQAQMSKLFQKERSVIGKHIKNIFEEGELNENEVCANFAHTTQHGAIKGKTQIQNVKLYNLDVIISVGYRVKSHQEALRKAHEEYEKFKEIHKNEISEVEKHFLHQIEHTQKKLKKRNKNE